ncbi:MAG: hypothetical protein PWQ51_750 [Methanolobus sp.]|jgi:hypothetical protein|nr:hypothetical protein [Methanolobus sp.]MDK2947752.1 hypothetical protein [Methanolobus sp.]
MELPQIVPLPFSSLIGDIEKGQIKIPQFQRDFVWDINKSAHLMDSIIKGYPIGTFIFWKTKERLRTIKNIGNQPLPEPDDGDLVDFVLDGQQRLTSLFASLKGLEIQRENGKIDDYSEMYINLESSEDEPIVITDISNKKPESVIKITDLSKGDFTVLSKYPEEHHETLKKYQQRIDSYSYSIIKIKDAPIDIATEIFSRINVGGKALSLFEIMVAKTFDPIRNFDLSEKFTELIERLEPFNYETISDASVLQLISLILEMECKRKTILKLDKTSFIDVWEKAVDSIERAVEYFRNYYRIPVSQLLPYNTLIVPFAYFFYYHPDKPTGDKQSYLEDFFWRCSLSGRYSSSVEGKLVQDIKRINSILKEELPVYDWAIDISPEFIKGNGWFSAGRSYIKAILCLYAYQQPKSFNDNSLVNISNYWLKQANSKNYHHFFPKAFLKKQGVNEFYINNILNITIVDDFLNKRKIKAKAPSIYMKEFEEHNSVNLAETMKTHLIMDLDSFGIWTDDYESFLNERAKTISDELQKRIITQDVDKKLSSGFDNDYEQTEIE